LRTFGLAVRRRCVVAAVGRDCCRDCRPLTLNSRSHCEASVLVKSLVTELRNEQVDFSVWRTSAHFGLLWFPLVYSGLLWFTLVYSGSLCKICFLKARNQFIIQLTRGWADEKLFPAAQRRSEATRAGRLRRCDDSHTTARLCSCTASSFRVDGT
jgi:hypothetical protein